MRLLRKVGHVTVEDLGEDNVLIADPRGIFYMIKDEDFKARPQVPIKIYPVVSSTKRTGMVPEYLAVLTDQDYDGVVIDRSDN